MTMTDKHFERACDDTADFIPFVANPTRKTGYETEPQHLRWMLSQAKVFNKEWKSDKAHRWLGFVQGVLVAEGFATVEDLKKVNMPDGEIFEKDRI